MINTPLLDAVMTHIKDHPELHEQSGWFTETECGTAACFAGWACLLSGLKRGVETGRNRWSSLVVDPSGGIDSAGDAAQKLLGLTSEQRDVLFCASNSRAMLELMVKDLSNSGNLYGYGDYYRDLTREG